MFLAKVIGNVVATKKEGNMVGQKLVLVRPMLVDDKDPSKFAPGKNTIVAIDGMGAGEGEMVLFCQGSSARQTSGLKGLPCDASIIGIVDSVDVLGKNIFKK
tara:strand:- start:698 stop:1003 length:306 start_codon:yes stop_codon:yes gene_type:complete